MIPIKDDNPTSTVPYVSITLIVINVLVFFMEATGDYDAIIRRYGLLPLDLMQGRNLHTIFTSMFLHAGLLHLGGNMLYLWIFADNVENYLGHGRFIVFYFACGVVAVFTHVMFSTNLTVPMVGASGAISGVLGAYMVKYPRARVLVVIPIFWFLDIRKIPAMIVLGFWFLMQLFSGVATLGHQGGGVAFWAHIGGFAAGVILILLMRPKTRRVVPYW